MLPVIIESYYIGKLRIFCGITAFVHLLQCITTFGLWLSKKDVLDNSLLFTTKTSMLWYSSNESNIYSYDIVNQISCNLIHNKPAMRNFKMAPIILYNSETEPLIIISIFYLLSFLFQFHTSNYWPFCKPYYKINNEIRFIEYSISASLMLITIAFQIGITDIYLLTNMFFNCFSCMIFGLLSQILMYDQKNTIIGIPLYIITHLCGWLTLCISYYPIIDVFYSSIDCSNTGNKSIPEFVKIIIILQALLFTSFGFIQIFDFIFKKLKYNKNLVNMIVDFMYILLSLVTKSLLGWIIIGNTYSARLKN